MFAVPGEITSSLSAGTHALLRLGATPLTSTEDVLESLGFAAPSRDPPHVSREAETVLAALREGAAGADQLASATQLDAGRLAAALAELELAGLAAEADGVYRASVS